MNTVILIVVFLLTSSALLSGPLFRYAQLNPFIFHQTRFPMRYGGCDCRPCGFLTGPDIDASVHGGNNRLTCACRKCDDRQKLNMLSPEMEYIEYLNKSRANSPDYNTNVAQRTTVSPVNEHPKCSNCHGLQNPNFHTF